MVEPKFLLIHVRVTHAELFVALISITLPVLNVLLSISLGLVVLHFAESNEVDIVLPVSSGDPTTT